MSRIAAIGFVVLVLAASAARAADEDGQDRSPADERQARATSDGQDAEREAVEPAASVAATERLELETTEVTGNRELPKVLYIVPWRKAVPGDLDGRPVNSLIEEVLAPLDREEFIRQVDYHSDLADAATDEDSEDRR